VVAPIQLLRLLLAACGDLLKSPAARLLVSLLVIAQKGKRLFESLEELPVAPVELARFPCACCGFVTLRVPPGSERICPICGWTDDLRQLLDPTLTRGANEPCLAEAQQNVESMGVSNEMRRIFTRGSTPSESREPSWRPYQPALDGGIRDPSDPYCWALHPSSSPASNS